MRIRVCLYMCEKPYREKEDNDWGTHASDGDRNVNENGEMNPDDDQKVNGCVLDDSTEQTGSPEHLHGFARAHCDHQERDYVWWWWAQKQKGVCQPTFVSQ